IRTSRDEEQLLVRATQVDQYERDAISSFERIMLVHKLRETRVLGGFSRVFPPTAMSLQDKMRLLRRTIPERVWLPAYIVYGEGLFFEFREKLVREWEQDVEVKSRAADLGDKYLRVQQARGGQLEPITPRLLLVHTFS